MSLNRKVNTLKTWTFSEPVYKDELVRKMTMEICYKVTNTNPSSIYIAINRHLE